MTEMSELRAPGRKTRFGVVGAGLWGSFHCKTLNAIPAAELYAVCDLDPKRAAEMQRQFGATKVYTDFRELIADPDVEAITVATPDFAHGDIVLAAIQAGKHVMSEKPLATTVAEAEAIAAAAATSPGKVMVDFHNRVSPPIVAVQQADGADPDLGLRPEHQHGHEADARELGQRLGEGGDHGVGRLLLAGTQHHLESGLRRDLGDARTHDA